MRRFSIYKRGTRFYVQYWNAQLKRYTTGKSTGATSRREATLIAMHWAEYGMPGKNGTRSISEALDADTVLNLVRQTKLTKDEASEIVRILEERDLVSVEERPAESVIRLVGFLAEVWDYDRSPYVKEKTAYGQRIGKRHCYDMSILVQRYWKGFFPEDKRLVDVNRDDLRKFTIYLSGQGLAPKTRNNILVAGTVAINWAFENQLIPSNPAQGLRKFSGDSKKRGVLTDEEVKKLFAMEWSDDRLKLANMLAATTGLRAGEIAALRVCDLGEGVLHIRHSWSEHDRLKSTKTGKDRTVPVLSTLRRKLIRLAHMNPHGRTDESYVFWSLREPDRPVAIRFFSEALQTMLVRMSLSKNEISDETKVKSAREAWRKRGVVFHSWRHYYSSRLSDHLDRRFVMLATGHTTQAVFDAYSSHETEEILETVRTTTEKVFSFVVAH